MKKEHIGYLAAVLALGVIAVVFWKGELRTLQGKFFPAGPSTGPITVPVTEKTQSALDEAWASFSAYRAAAAAHNLATLASLTYKLSPTCQQALAGDGTKLKDCQSMMDSVAIFSKNFKESDFTEALSDAKQSIIATGYIPNQAQGATVKTVLYFVRNNPTKLAGIRICLDQDRGTNECNITAASKQDLNNNGYWDAVEYFFNR